MTGFKYWACSILMIGRLLSDINLTSYFTWIQWVNRLLFLNFFPENIEVFHLTLNLIKESSQWLYFRKMIKSFKKRNFLFSFSPVQTYFDRKSIKSKIDTKL